MIKPFHILNDFFSNVVVNLNIPEYNGTNPMKENINDLVWKGTNKYNNHLSILAIYKLCNQKKSFSFTYVEKKKRN